MVKKLMIKTVYLVSLVIFLSIEVGAQSRKATAFMNEYLEAAFWKTGEKVQPLTKWGDVDTLTYLVAGEFEFMSAKKWTNFTNEMSALIGKEFIESTDESYHILIYFGTLEDYSGEYNIDIPVNLAEKFSNWSARRFGKGQELVKSSFCIDPTKVINYNEGEYFLQKLFAKSLGILGESQNEYSLFFEYYNANNERLTREDRRIIKLHYNSMLKPGMSQSEARKILEQMDLDILTKEKL
jgi:hypothetical protein